MGKLTERGMKTKIRIPAAAIFILFCLFPGGIACDANETPAADQAAWNELNAPDRSLLDGILAHWETWMPAKKADGSAPLSRFEALYEGLSAEQKDFLDRVRAIKPSALEIPPDSGFTRIEDQWIQKQGAKEKLGPQYLPSGVYGAYEKMMEAMRRDLGKRLYVDSGYRSPAYQLYTFLFFMPKHHYSIRETREWVALPGHSEHGDPGRQAIDFINEEGENGEETAGNFERLPEYAWLVQNAGRFGFELSYPQNTAGTTFEPWHWRYVIGSKVEGRGSK